MAVLVLKHSGVCSSISLLPPEPEAVRSERPPLQPDRCDGTFPGLRPRHDQAAEHAGLEARITGHSGQRGVVTTGCKRTEKLRGRSGWSAKPPVFWDCIDKGEKCEDATTDGIGL
ncbi:hypothetical protein ACWGE1_06880 [Streptomyces sp. NPDC054932]